MTVSSCKGCTDRKLGCHDSCERYKSWKAEYNKQSEWLKKDLIMDRYACDSCVRKFGQVGRKKGAIQKKCVN